MTKQTPPKDVVIDAFMEPVFEGWHAEIREFLRTTPMMVSSLRIRTGKLRKIMSVDEYLNGKSTRAQVLEMNRKIKTEKVKKLLIEAFSEGRNLSDMSYEEAVEKIATEYSKKIMHEIKYGTRF